MHLLTLIEDLSGDRYPVRLVSGEDEAREMAAEYVRIGEGHVPWKFELWSLGGERAVLICEIDL